ncbi:MAG: hypothetical protein II998_11740 [Clostridia bacterium]|nr:hypothetical protein [Clostridia bacterium]
MDAINILMIGGKRCGKTTVLASMCNEIGKALAGTGMQLMVKNEQTHNDLQRAISNIKQKIELFNKPLTRVEVDDNPTSAQKTYSFALRLNDGGKEVPFQITDIPGEWLTDTHQAQVKNLVHASQVIMIAIDTPYLFAKMMTDKGYGIYHEEYNKPMEIANFFKNSLSTEDLMGRLILFVPIKCERYYHLTHTPELNAFGRDYMLELVNAIGDGYRELLHYLKSTPQLVTSCTMAITPILSAGGIDFVHFKTDAATGKVISLYQEAEFMKDYDKGYSPKFCEQPMIYALTYIMARSLQNTPTASGIKGLYQSVNPKELSYAYEVLRKKIKKGTGTYSEDGFLVLQDYMKIL